MMRKLLLFAFLCVAFTAHAQYSETFSTPNKGYLLNNVNDFTGVGWSLTTWNPDPFGRDDQDYFSTTAAGVLESVDLDQEVCWLSPLLTASVTGNIAFTADISWEGFDVNQTNPLEYINVEYRINAGSWIRHPNVLGANGDPAYTVRYTGGAGGNGSATTNFASIAVTTGNSIELRICVSDNANAEIVRIDNINVTGVGSGCAAPVLTTAVTPVGCGGPNTGAINLSVSAGTPGYTYDWSNDGPENPDNDPQDLSGLPAGTYTVTVTDAASCSATISATVGTSTAITLSSQILNATCSGSIDGEIDLIVSGGFPGFTYDWSNDGPENPDNDPQDLVGLSPGTYTVTVTDAVGCTKTLSAVIGITPPAAYLETFSIPNKGYLPNFVDDFSAVNWSLSAWAPQPPAAFGRDLEDYFMTTGGALVGVDLDQEICWTSPVIDINPPGTVQFSLSLAWTGFDNDVAEYINVKYSVNGGSPVTVPNQVGGGAGTIQYVSGIDVNGSTTVTVPNISGNTLQISVCGNTNANGETITLDNVSVPNSVGTYCPGPEPSVTVVNVSCNGAANGSIDLTVINGSSPYNYLWSNGAITQDISGLAPGIYTVTVTDANMLTATASGTITQPSAIVITNAPVTNVLCNGANTGAIDISISGGVSPYTYDWSNDGPETPDNDPQDLSGLPAGTYTVTVTDATNCSKTAVYTITQPSVILLSTVPVNVLCNGGTNGSIDLTVSGGVGPYSFNWGAGQPTTEDRSNLSAGAYCVTVTDANSCTKTTCVTITQPPALTLSRTFVNVLCNGAATGSIDLTVTGGTGAYSYNWGAGQPTTEDRTNLTAGTYTVTVTDANSCTQTISTTITQPSAISLNAVPTNVLCAGSANGAIDLTVSGGVSPYTYDWSNDGPETPDNDPQDLSGLSGGIYTVTVTDANNCTVTTSVTITEPAATITASSTVVNPTNCGVPNGSIDLTVSGGATPYTYDWSNDGPENPDNDPQDLTGLTVGTYTVTITDANGCTISHTQSLVYNDNSAPTIVCPANLSLAIVENCSVALPNYPPASVGDNCTPNPTVTQSPAAGTVLSGHNTTQTVTLTATDENGNTASCSFVVTLKDVVAPLITCPANLTISANAQCSASLGNYAAVSVSDNCTPNPSVTQSPAAGTVLNGHNFVQIVTLTASDGNNAFYTSTCTFSVTVKDVTPPAIVCPANQTISANASCSGTVGTWTPVSVSDNCNANPAVNQSPSGATVLTGHNATQTLSLTASDGNGNSASCTFTVTLKDVTAPLITCPANQTINAGPGCSGTVGTWTPVSVSDNCNGSPALSQSPVASTALNGHNAVQTVSLTASDGNGNTTNCTFTVTLKDITAPVITCPASTTVNANASCSATVGTWNAVSVSDNCNASPAVSQSPAAATVFSGHNTVQTVSLTASDGNGNSAGCSFTLTLKDASAPVIVCPANQTISANASCAGTVGAWNPVSVSDNCNASPAVNQTPAAATPLNGHNASQTVSLTATDGNGNSASCTFTVTLIDNTKPVISCPANTTVTSDANCSSMIGAFNAVSVSDNCTAAPGVTQSPSPSTIINGTTPSQVVTLTATDNAGNTQTCTFTVSIVDQIAPVITCPANATVAAGDNCSATLGTLVPASVSDNCTPNPVITQSPAASTVLSGHNDTRTVVLTATDGSGNSSSCSFIVTLKDVTAPLITCPANQTVNANASCSGVVGSYTAIASDNCGTPTTSQSPAASTVLTGHNDFRVVTFTATDAAGNTKTCTFTVTLKDVTAPTVVCKNANADLNAAGTATITTASVFQSGSDNCGPVTQVSVTPSTFTCSNLGANTVVLTVNDINGNTSTCSAVVTVRDLIAPTILCKPATLQLNAQGQATLTAAMVNNGSFDNCTLSFVVVSPVNFTCANIGNNTVELSGADQSGNKAFCTTTVTITDPILPVALCKNLTVNIGANGSVTVAPAQINNGSSDNCSFTLSLTPATFTCANIGNNTVTLRATDTGGNTATCTAVVTVRDQSAPAALCKNATIFLDNQGQATLSVAQVDNGSSDNCGISTKTLSQTEFNCSELAGSPWAVIMTLKDAYNNTSSCVSYVTVKDAIAPNAVCENTTVQLAQNGTVVVYSNTLADNSTDNCSVWTYSPIAKVYNTSNIGNNNLTITVKDFSNNGATCVSVVTVIPYAGKPGDRDEQESLVSAPEFGLHVYPNPTAGEAMLEFELPEAREYRLQIYDLSGRVVLSRDGQGVEALNSVPLAMGNVSPGIYMLELRSGELRAITRLVVQE